MQANKHILRRRLLLQECPSNGVSYPHPVLSLHRCTMSVPCTMYQYKHKYNYDTIHTCTYNQPRQGEQAKSLKPTRSNSNHLQTKTALGFVARVPPGNDRQELASRLEASSSLELEPANIEAQVRQTMNCPLTKGLPPTADC